MIHGLPDIALSVRQPWAWAIIHAGKPVENRYWRRPNPGLQFRGPVAIHAAKGMTRDEYESARDFIEQRGHRCPPAAELQRGGIIGSAYVLDVVRAHASPWFFGPVALELGDVKPCPFVPARGALGFFRWQEADPSTVPEPARWMRPVPRVDPAPEHLDFFGDHIP